MQETPSVLIVDDERADLDDLERDLNPLRLRLLTLQDGHQLLDRVRAERPDLVLLDALLPGLSGFDLCKQIKTSAESRNTLVVILTGVYVKDQYRQDAMRQFKADGFLTKPYRTPELHRLVLRLLSRKLRTTPGELRQTLREVGEGVPSTESAAVAPPAEKKGWLSRLFGRARPAGPPAPEPSPVENIENIGAVPAAPLVEDVPGPSSTPLEAKQSAPAVIQLGPGEMSVSAEPPETPQPMPLGPPVEEPERPLESREPGVAEAAPGEEASVPMSGSEPLLPPPPANEDSLLQPFAPVEPVEPVARGGSAASEAPGGKSEKVEASDLEQAKTRAEPEVAESVTGGGRSTAAGGGEPSCGEDLQAAAETSVAPAAVLPAFGSSSPASNSPPALTAAAPMGLVHVTEPAISQENIEKPGEAPALFEDVFKPEPAPVTTATPPPPPLATPSTHAPATPASSPVAGAPRPFFVSVQPGLPIYREEAFFSELSREISRCRRAAKPLTLLLIRVDDLGQIAELFGLESKNQVLRHVAELAVETARDVDMAGLLVSMQLVGLTAFASDRYGGGRIAARILRAATRRPFVVAEGFPPIIPALRFGMATFPTDTQDPAELIFRAREELASLVPRKV